MEARRAYGVTLAVLLAGSGLLLLAYGLTWATAEVPLLAGADDAVRVQDFTGRDLLPGAAMAGWVSLAAVAGVIATRSWGRVVVALLAALAGLAGAAGALVFAAMPTMLVDDAVSLALGTETYVRSTSTLSWALAAIAGLVVAVAAGWTAVRGRRWPSLGRKYERTPAPAVQRSAWEAQDFGQDPTDDLVE